MAGDKPILILQMQRLGDLVLTYPLLGWLAAQYPGHPLWVVGEADFFSPLMPLSPPATYFPYSAKDRLATQTYHLLINLSHRPEAAALASALKSERRIGSYLDEEGHNHIAGDWQLYRHSLVRNNRFNLFHWADLNALDVTPLAGMRRTNWPPRKKPGRQGRVGLFLGASETAKRPEVAFWVELARNLLKYGYKPVLLGGKAENTLGKEAHALLRGGAPNLCGRFAVGELAEFISGLDLLVAPDTGPMHIAVWVGTAVLNLSLGPVNAWETGPFAPGHHVLRSTLPCVGCWQCERGTVACKAALSAARVAFIVHFMLLGADPDQVESGADLSRLELPEQQLFVTRRDRYGLFELAPLRARKGGAEARHLISRFWQAFFGFNLGVFPEGELKSRLNEALNIQPGLASALTRHSEALARRFLDIKKSGRWQELAGEKFWQDLPSVMKPLGSYLQLLMQNGECSLPAQTEALRRLDHLHSLVCG